MCNCKRYIYNTLRVVRECFNNICLRGNTTRLKIRWFDVLNERKTKRSQLEKGLSVFLTFKWRSCCKHLLNIRADVGVFEPWPLGSRLVSSL